MNSLQNDNKSTPRNCNILKHQDAYIVRVQLLLSNLFEKTAVFKEVDKGILEIMIDTEGDETCETEAEEARGMKEKVTYHIFLLEDALKQNLPTMLQPIQNLERSLSFESLITSSRSSVKGTQRKVSCLN